MIVTGSDCSAVPLPSRYLFSGEQRGTCFTARGPCLPAPTATFPRIRVKLGATAAQASAPRPGSGAGGAGSIASAAAMEKGSKPPPILSKEDVLERLQAQRQRMGSSSMRAFYSSVVGGITTDPAAMVLPIDDHMVHRGHAVFDTAKICCGQLYELDEHLDRFLRSAQGAKIQPHFSRDWLRGTILATASASGIEDGYLKYWLSAGPGGFSISTAECNASSFYAMAIEEAASKEVPSAVKMITAKTPMKSPLMATTKTVNYLPNALVHMEAEEAGVYEALWIDERGCIGEGPTMNVAFVSEDGVLLVPSFERILAGCTIKRVMKLAEQLVGRADAAANGSSDPPHLNGHLEAHSPLLRGIRFGPVPEAEARKAREMFLVGSGHPVKPVVEWDGAPVGSGEPGPVAAALHALLMEDQKSGLWVPIPTLYYHSARSEVSEVC